MLAGKLDKRVTFERLSTTTDAEGSTVETWSTLFSRWAMINIENATETFKNNQDFAVRTGFIIIRLDPDTKNINANDRFSYAGEYWEVLGVINVNARDEILEIAIRKYAS